MRKGHGSTAFSRAAGPRFVAHLATCERDVVEAQRLRWRVFAEEMGARLPEPALRLDRDRFDPYCEHLLVREAESGLVVGTYRMLPGREARKLGGFYSEGEFALGRLRDLPGLVEVGRACVHPDHRRGAVLGLLWAGLARFLHERGHAHVIGCGSIPAGDEREGAAAVCRLLARDHLVAAEWRVAPRTPFAAGEGPVASAAALPPLIRGYLRLGALICGPPAWDGDFRTADVLLWLPMARLDGRWARRLLGAA